MGNSNAKKNKRKHYRLRLYAGLTILLAVIEGVFKLAAILIEHLA